MAEFVTLEVTDGIGTIRLDRPPMNALNRQLQEEIRAAARAASVDSSVKAVIVYGGEKVFAAGADIKEMAELSAAQMAAIAGELQSALGSLAEIPKPVVAAVTGYALGGGSWATTSSSASPRCCWASSPAAVGHSDWLV